ncbi:MAG: tetratricopeptide repeat protein [Rhodothermales bacterium]|nr:tetratricopeptide repeat protein [Rhodothermales bacterium]
MRDPASDTSPEAPRAAPLSRGKRWAFTLGMALLPVLFFGLLEGGLRLAGYGEAYPLFVPAEGHPDYLHQSRDVARRYFYNAANPPTSLLDLFTAEKDSATFRIFVQGGSSAAGFPFYYGGAFSRMLEQRLLQTFPGRPIEVINTAMAAVNSYTLLDLSDEILAQQPDAVLVYAGHNEYYGALGVGSSESLGGGALTRLYLRLRALRTVQALRDGLGSLAGWMRGRGQGRPPSATLMERMVGEQSIPYGSPLYREGLAQFRANLSALLARYAAHGVPVFVGTLASNDRDHAPFLSGLAPETDAAAWQAHLQQARAALAARDSAAALAALGAALALDSLAADAFYLKGRILDGQGHREAARRAYVAARDRDQLRFRAPEAMNRILREEAARHGATVVEVQAALEAASPGGVVGASLMLEHLHPNLDGYFRIADAFYEALRAAALIGPWTRPVPAQAARREVLLTPVDSLVGVLRVRQLMAHWPFQPPGVVDPAFGRWQPSGPVEQLAYDLWRGDVTWAEANRQLQRYYAGRGDLHRALQAALARVQEYPLLAEPYLAAGNVLLRQRRLPEALTYFEAANDREETAAAQTMIGSILLQRGDREAAIARLQRALTLDPRNQQALYNLSGAYALTGQTEQARATVLQLLAVAPEHRDGRRLLSSLGEGGD